LNLTVTEAASQIVVSRVGLSRVLNGRAAISPDTALRLEALLGEAGASMFRFLLIAKASVFAYHTVAYVKSEIAPFSEINHREDCQ
jgi:hypothetical protein